MASSDAPADSKPKPKWPRKYERVPGLDEIDQNDFVALTKARHQHARDRVIDLEEIKILRQRVQDCARREDVNYPQRCREEAMAYMEAFRKYKTKRWSRSY